MKSKAGYIKAITLAIFVAAGTFWSARHVSGFTLIERPIDFANISLQPGQTIRLHVANTGESPIAFRWGVDDDKGNNLLPAIQSSLEPRHSTFIDLNADNVRELSSRMQVRAWVKASALTKGSAGATLASLELFENSTGAIIAVLNPASVLAQDFH